MIKRIFTLLLAALVSGCVTTGPYVSENFVVRGGVVKLGEGRELPVAEFCRLEKKLSTLSIKEQEEIHKNPAAAKCSELQMQSAFGTTWIRDIGTNATPAVLGGITQGIMAKSVAREADRICRADGSGCGKGGGSVSSSGAGAEANVIINLSCGASGCGR